MKKKIITAICIVLAVLLIALIVLNVSFRKITVASGKEFVDKCPRYARPGQEVTITTAVIADGEIYVNGADGEYVQPGVYVFTMPDTDVQIKVTVIAYRDGA